jgi:hypothetical protein
VKAADEVGKDTICCLIFLNLVVDEEKGVSHHLKEPFKTALESKIVLNGREKQTPLELLDFIIYEPELSTRLMNDLKDIFSSVGDSKTVAQSR